MAWNLEGTYFETCSCEVVCPCTASLALGADYDRCRVTLVFNITRGEVEGTDVSGLKVAAVGDSPKVPIEVREEGLRHSVRIGDAIDFEIEDVVPFGVESGEPARLTGIFHPAASELTISRATRSRINAFGIEYEGKAGSSTSRFAWSA
jgi:hypothetical protein